MIFEITPSPRVIGVLGVKKKKRIPTLGPHHPSKVAFTRSQARNQEEQDQEVRNLQFS